ncbi:18159_t:CDS:2, partial [Funneliformis geosporum]
LNNDVNIKDLLKLAEQKLLGGAESRITSELVARFIGIRVHVSEDQCRLLVFYPSELIVAEAAASLMRHEIVFRKLLNFLLDALHTDQATGSKGLLSSSMSSHLENLEYMREFVSQLIRDNYNDYIQDLSQKFADGLLAFTHFIPLTYTPTQIELKSLFIHYTAVICKRNQAGVDLILPVLKLSKEYVFKGRITEVRFKVTDPTLGTSYPLRVNINNVSGHVVKVETYQEIQKLKAGFLNHLVDRVQYTCNKLTHLNQQMNSFNQGIIRLELVLNENNNLQEVEKASEMNSFGMEIFTLFTPKYLIGKKIIVFANDIKYHIGSFDLLEDQFFYKETELARSLEYLEKKGETQHKITNIIGSKDELGVKCLNGSGFIA